MGITMTTMMVTMAMMAGGPSGVYSSYADSEYY